MVIRVQCACGEVLTVSEAMAGQQGTCMVCGQPVHIPSPTKVVAAKPDRAARTGRRAPSISLKRLAILFGCGAGLALLVIFGPAILEYLSTAFSQSEDRPYRPEAVPPVNEGKPAAPVPAPVRPTLLAWRLDSGKPLYVEMTTRSQQATTMAAKTLTESLAHTCFYRWVPKEQKDGSWVIEKTIEGCRLQMRSGIRSIEFDTTRKEEADGPLASALVGATMRVAFGPEWKIADVKGNTELIEALSDIEPQLRSVFEASFSEAALQQMADGFFQAVPGTTKKPGDTWTRERSMPALLGGRYDAAYRYTYEGLDGSLERIRLGAKMLFHPGSDDAQPGMAVRETDLHPQLAGSMLFDSTKGRLAQADMSFTLRGTVRLEGAGRLTTVEISTAKTTTVKTSDESPLKGMHASGSGR